jgi:hypothetical protein
MTILDHSLHLAAFLDAPNDGLMADDQVSVRETSIYATWAPRYREAGFDPRPIWPGQKSCHIYGWNLPMPDDIFEQTLITHADYGIGLLMGSRFPDGTTLATLDVDDDQYIEVSKVLLGDPPCIRRGSKGVGIFVRVRGNQGYLALKARGSPKRHSELLTRDKLLVIPPTIHPATGKPYEWLTPSLLDVDFNDLPIIEA